MNDNQNLKLRVLLDSTELPPNCFFYEVDGRKIFEIRSETGGLATSVICYLVVKLENGLFYKFAIEFATMFPIEFCALKLNHRVEELKFLLDKRILVGGPFGYGEDLGRENV